MGNPLPDRAATADRMRPVGNDGVIPAASQTTSALLEQLLDARNHAVWKEFDERYRPILTGFARRLGLTLADAEDAAQEALTRFVQHYQSGAYDRERGRLRTWMISIARNCVMDALRTRAVRRERRGMSGVVDEPAPDELEAAWDAECRRTIATRALAELRATTRFDDRTIQAFEMLTLENRPPSFVATELGLSVDSVYAAKHRCAKALREIVERLRDVYEVA